MGCIPSRPSHQSKPSPPSPLTHRRISPPIGGPIMVPSPTPPPYTHSTTTFNNNHNLPTRTSLTQKLTRADLVRALDLVSLYLDHNHRNEGPITIIALGGALHVLHLRNRLSTTALQFFHPDPASPQNTALAAAAAFAVPVATTRTSFAAAIRHTDTAAAAAAAAAAASVLQDDKSRTNDAQLPPSWLTNTVILSLPLPLQSQIASCAHRQNDATYTSASGRLRVLAAPWEYVFVSAVARLSYATAPWDMADAVAALRRWVGLRGGRPVQGPLVLRRARDVWGVSVDREVLGQVEAVFEAVWGVRGVVW